MDRTKAREFRNRTRFGTRLKYTTRPGVPPSPTAPSFVIERRLPKNYKTIKTSSRSTVATSSSLSTFNLEEDLTTERYSPNHEDRVREKTVSPKQAFDSNRQSSDHHVDTGVISRKVTQNLPYILSKKNQDDVKVSGYEVHEQPDKNIEETKSRKPKLIKSKEDNINLIPDENLHEKKEKDYASYHESALTDSCEGGDHTFITNSKSVKDREPNRLKEESKTLKNETSDETERDWQPITSKPRANGAQDPRDRCLNECGKCGDAENKLKLLPCLHSFCLKCLKGLVTEKHRKMIQCTLCGSKSAVPTTGLEALENNYYFHFSELSLSENDRCDICSAKTPVSRCTECKLNLCSDCVTDHLSDSDKNHYVVNVNIEMIGHAPWNAPCSRHNPFNLELFCINCSQLICGRCALESHNNHVTENAEHYARDKRRQLETRLADHLSSRIISNIDDHIKLLKREKESLQKDIDKTVASIKNHVSTLKDKLDEFCAQVVGDVEHKGEVYSKSFDKRIDSVQQKRKATYISLETLKQIVHRTRDIELITKHSSLVDIFSDLSLENKLDIVPHLEVSYISLLDSLNKSVGRVNVNAQLTKTLVFAEEISVQFPRHVVSICPIDTTRAWVGFRKHIQQCTKDGNLGLRIGVNDFVVSIDKSSGDTIYIASRTCVKVLSNKMMLKEAFSLAHEPSDMKFNQRDEIVIAFKDARRVALFSNRGVLLKEFDIRHFGYRFGVRMNDPWKLAITDNHDILLTDYTSEHIAEFDENCEMKSTFRSNVYKQASIAYDSGLLHIIDYKRDCLNLFSEDGYFLQSQPLEGLKAPSCIAVKFGYVWIGSWNGLVKYYRVK